VQGLFISALTVKVFDERLISLGFNETSRLRDNLQPPAIDLNFPIPTVAIILMRWPTPQRVSTPG
jgi:hypothetical protein